MEECSVCKKIVEETYVVAGRYGSYSFSACEECITNGYESYENMTSPYGFGKIITKKYPNGLRSEVLEDIRRMLPVWGKTEEQYVADCKEQWRKYKE